MTATSKFMGHKIKHVGGQWVFCDTLKAVEKTHPIRECGNCGEMATIEGHDSCLGTLPGVMNACCGHGAEDEAYVQFSAKRCLRGAEAVEEINRLRKI